MEAHEAEDNPREHCPRCGWDPHPTDSYEDRWCRVFTNRTNAPPTSAVTIEFADEAERINAELSILEQYLYKLMSAWHGELQGRNHYHSMATWFHEKAEGAESAARSVREAVERIIEGRGGQWS